MIPAIRLDSPKINRKLTTAGLPRA
jgi:hypothetical protein